MVNKPHAAVRRTSRKHERGAVIFVVVLVLAVLSAIGIFAVRAAGLNQRVSGYARQATQTGYVAEYGTLAMVDELSSERKTIYMAEMSRGTELCRANQYVDAGTLLLPCYRIYMSELQARITEEGSGALLFDNDGGSLGPSQLPLTADFVVEMTDRSRAGRDMPGMDQGGVGPRFRYDQVTLSATGQVRPVISVVSTNGGVCTTSAEQYAAQVAGTRSMRAIVQVGPIPE